MLREGPIIGVVTKFYVREDVEELHDMIHQLSRAEQRIHSLKESDRERVCDCK
jgi:hypothetical protein